MVPVCGCARAGCLVLVTFAQPVVDVVQDTPHSVDFAFRELLPSMFPERSQYVCSCAPVHARMDALALKRARFPVSLSHTLARTLFLLLFGEWD
jgi:hypothetical protein